MRHAAALILGLFLFAWPSLATADDDPPQEPAPTSQPDDNPDDPDDPDDSGNGELPSVDELLSSGFGLDEDDSDDDDEDRVDDESPIDPPSPEEIEFSDEPPSDPMDVVHRPDEQFVIIDIRLPRLTLTRDMPGYYDGEELYIPLWLFVEVVEFPIDVDFEKGRAQGWALTEDRTIDLDVERGTIIIGEKSHPLEPGDVERHYDDLYVRMELLAQWFELQYDFNYSLMRLELEPELSLPAQLRMERAERQQMLDRMVTRDDPEYDLVPTPFELATRPVHDLRIDASVPTARQLRDSDRRRNVPQTNSYHLRGAGDLFYTNAYWSISGSETHPVRRIRFRMERKDPGGNLLGELGATEIKAGDVVSPSIAHVARSSPGRGVEVSSFPLTRPSDFDTTTISGPMEPGWEVELYRNDVLIDYQSASDADQYRFEEVPLLFGMNEILIVHHGPHGERRKEQEIFHIGRGMITPGEDNYRVSISQHNTDLIPLGTLDRETDVDGRPRIVAEYERGISEAFAVATTMNTLPLRDGRQRFYTTVGVRNSLSRAYTTFDLIAGRGLGIQAATQTRISDYNLVAESAYFFAGFDTERIPRRTHSVRNRTRIRFNGILPFDEALRVPFRLTLENDRLSDLGHRTTLSNRLSTRVSDFVFVHSSQLLRQPEGALSLHGSLSTRRRSRTVSPNAQISYGTTGGIRTAQLGANWRIHNDMQARGDFVQQFGEHSDTTLRTGLNHRLDPFTWGANIGYSYRGGFSIGATISSSFGHNPQTERWEPDSHTLTSSGVVVPRVFWDKSQDGVFNPDVDEPIDEAEFRVNRVSRSDYQTDETGRARLPQVPTNDFVDVKVDKSSLYDPFFVPDPEGHSVVTRPGTVTFVDFPVVMTGEIDGTVRFDRGDGQFHPAANIGLQLVDETGEVVDETRSAFDGFYLFDFIKPGTYEVRILPEQIGNLHLEVPDEVVVDIDVDGTIVTGQDFNLRRFDSE